MKFRSSLLLTVALISTIAVTSCTKSYTCKCAIQYSGSPGLPDSTTNSFQITDSKSNAQSECKNQSGTYDNNGIHTVETCVLY